MTTTTRPGPATQRPRALTAVAVAPAVLHGRTGRPVVRDGGQAQAGSPGPGPVARSPTARSPNEATVQGERVAGNLFVQPVAPVVGAQLGGGVGERGPVA
jgi:hypothetical protein